MTQLAPVSLSLHKWYSSSHLLRKQRSECERKNKIWTERAKLWQSPVLSSLAPQWLAQQCQRARSGSHISCTLKHTLTELNFTLAGAVCYPSGSVPSACLPAHHINPIMLRCLGCSGSGRPPSGKRGGGHEEEEREGESEEKRRSHTDTDAGRVKSEEGPQGLGSAEALQCETSTHKSYITHPQPPLKSILFVTEILLQSTNLRNFCTMLQVHNKICLNMNSRSNSVEEYELFMFG